MSDISTLLDLPVTSSGFTSIKASPTQSLDGSPPRKAARMEGDSDSGSASRSRDLANNGELLILKVVGEPMPTPLQDVSHQHTQIKRAIRTLLTPPAHSPEPIPISYEAVYCACRVVVTGGGGEELYTMLKVEVEQCLGRLIRDLRVGHSNMDVDGEAVQWLGKFVEACVWFSTQVGILRGWVTYLDRAYALRKPGTANCHDYCITAFSNKMYLDPDITTHIQAGIRAWVTGEREQGPPSPVEAQRVTIRALIHHLHLHNSYCSVFETPYLSFAIEHYLAESKQLYEQLKGTEDAWAFVAHVSKRVDEERKRCERVLLARSWDITATTVEQMILQGRLVWIADNALPTLMEKKDTAKLGTLYSLFARNSGTKTLCNAFKVYVYDTVKLTVLDKTNDDGLVQRMLDLKLYLDGVLPVAFADAPPSPGPSTAVPTPNQDFAYALTDAFQSAFTPRRVPPLAELFAKHLDQLLRQGQKTLSLPEYEGKLDGVLGLYRFTGDKDVFRAFYFRALARRLLLGRSASDDWEKGMVRKLKEQYDPEFGTGEHMFKDLALSRDTLSEFRKHASETPGVEKVGVMVLQQSVWPFAPRKGNADLPPSMQDLLGAYTSFYISKHQGHKLTWDHALGTATLAARFAAGNKELSVSLYQCVVLLLFNDNVELAYKDIEEGTRMGELSYDGSVDVSELKRTLQSLACGMKKVLRKRPEGKDVNDGDIFFFNTDFTDPRTKVHINSIQAKETPEESRKTHISIEGDRKHYLDAAIVRIMKARKSLAYEALKAATIEAVKVHFLPEVKVIKERIDALVEQEYLKRDEDDRNLFTYVA
ncbi:hypothetical protein FIBSPDRAFT_882127 [Athelia psychrophila]|uniref:Cullin family profile domain-containing protein n=1 Tax=Athelia psychrophila TaxID=1759441 RepID=A0A166VJE5_9AGAM|nr:hypothetical protein FIBSPDRAFT_882127 [Fibularhizoctonia sp. CBS 109695]